MKLSPRHRQVLLWTARGKTAEDISLILGCTYGTVKVHKETAARKLGALNTTHAIVKAIAKGALSVEEIMRGY